MQEVHDYASTGNLLFDVLNATTSGQDRTPPTATLIWIMLANHADGRARAWPSIGTLAAGTRAAQSTVKACLWALEYNKRITLVGRHGKGGHASKVYQVHVVAGGWKDPPKRNCDPRSRPPATADHRPRPTTGHQTAGGELSDSRPSDLRQPVVGYKPPSEPLREPPKEPQEISESPAAPIFFQPSLSTTTTPTASPIAPTLPGFEDVVDPPPTSKPPPTSHPPTSTAAATDEERRVFEAFLKGRAWRRINKGATPVLDPKRLKIIRSRIEDGFPIDDLAAAAQGIWTSEWHFDQQQCRLDLALRDAEHIEKFAALHHEKLEEQHRRTDDGEDRSGWPESPPPPPLTDEERVRIAPVLAELRAKFGYTDAPSEAAHG